jgi:hypothetical protein
MESSDVARVYYEEKDLTRIVRYCEKDVITLARVYLKLTLKPSLREDEIVSVS